MDRHNLHPRCVPEYVQKDLSKKTETNYAHTQSHSFLLKCSTRLILSADNLIQAMNLLVFEASSPLGDLTNSTSKS